MELLELVIVGQLVLIIDCECIGTYPLSSEFVALVAGYPTCADLNSQSRCTMFALELRMGWSGRYWECGACSLL